MGSSTCKCTSGRQEQMGGCEFFIWDFVQQMQLVVPRLPVEIDSQLIVPRHPASGELCVKSEYSPGKIFLSFTSTVSPCGPHLTSSWGIRCFNRFWEKAETGTEKVEYFIF